MLSALSPSQQPTGLFSIYQNNTWTIRRLVDQPSDRAYYIEDCRISILILFCFIRPCRHSSALPLARMDWLDNPCSSCLLLHFRRNLQDHFENENKFNNIIPRWGIIATIFFPLKTQKSLALLEICITFF